MYFNIYNIQNRYLNIKYQVVMEIKVKIIEKSKPGKLEDNF